MANVNGRAEIDGKTFSITAFLTNAIKIPIYGGGYALRGEIHGDIQNRFVDGTEILTSVVYKEQEPNLFLTRSNNLYSVTSWADSEPAAAAPGDTQL
jgi:hypothetical protein